jgi:hypothetical protein
MRSPRAIAAIVLVALAPLGLAWRRHRAAPAPVRVGQMVYRVDAVALEPTVSVGLYRANVTQTFVRVSEGSIFLVLADGTRYSPARVLPEWCRGLDDCTLLDPGDARMDTLEFALPPAHATVAALEVHALASDPGPPVARLPLHE